MGSRLVVVVVAVTIGCAHEPRLVSRPPGPAGALVVRNVRLFDAPRAALIDGLHDVVLRDGRIAAIEPAGHGPADVPAVDGNGETLLPGLVDVHAHTGSSAQPWWRVSLPDVDATLGAFLYAGVTTALDLGNLVPAVFRERDDIASGRRLGPRLYAAGPMFTAPGGHPVEVLRASLPWYLRWYVIPRAAREVGTPEAARAAVGALLGERPDLLKLAVDAGPDRDVPRLDPATIAAIVAAGHAAGVRSIAHVGTAGEALDAVRGGVDALAHAPFYQPLTDDAVAAIAAARIPVVPTLAIWDGLETQSRAADFLPIEREVGGPALVADLLAPPPTPETAAQLAFHRALAAAHEGRRQNVARLRAAGVPLLVGSDASNPGQLPGAGLHRELAKLVEAGVPPGEALRAATFDNARFLAGPGADFGEIAVGKRADLVLVAGDPVARVTDLGRITHVFLGGALLERRAHP